MTQRMKATKPIEYRGRTINPGEVFPVKAEDVNTFNVQQSAVLTNEVERKTRRRTVTRKTTKAPVSAVSTRNLTPKTRTAASKAKPTAKAGAKVTTAKRRYNRRDMQAR